MSWTCYSCKAKNPNSAATCAKCGGNLALPRQFYIQWVFGGAVFFFATFILGRLFGGIMMSLSESEVFRETMLWLWPALLFVLCGMLIGFASDGITILEAGLGSILGQALAVAILIYYIDASVFNLNWGVFFIGSVPGAILAALGAWMGEKLQVWMEQRGGITG